MVSLSLVRNKTSSPKFYLFSDALVLVQVSNSVSGCQRGGRGEVGRMQEVTGRPGVGGRCIVMQGLNLYINILPLYREQLTTSNQGVVCSWGCPFVKI